MLCNAYDDMSSFNARSKHQRCYRAKCPYVQFAAARVTSTWFAVGLQIGERGRGSEVSGGRSKRVLRARLPLSRVLVSCFLCPDPPFMGRPAFPFIGEGKARVTEEKKEKNEREKKASRVAGSFFSFMLVSPIL